MWHLFYCAALAGRFYNEFLRYGSFMKHGIQQNTGHTQKTGAVLIVNTIKTAPFFCVYPVQAYRILQF
jgi:hypothetical protein